MAGRVQTPAAQRFAEKCSPPDERGCVLWTGGTSAKGDKGYGLFYADGSMRSAHRWAYEQVHGPLPAHLDACHSCDVRRCVNVAHLFAGTRKANMEDAKAKGRTHEKRPNHSGAKHHAATVTEAQVRRIRELHAQGLGLKQIGAEIPAAYMTLYRIINRTTWTHI